MGNMSTDVRVWRLKKKVVNWWQQGSYEARKFKVYIKLKLKIFQSIFPIYHVKWKCLL